MKKWGLITAAVVIVLLGAAAIVVHLQLSGALSRVAQTMAPGDAMPTFTLTDYEGATHSLSDYRGKLVVLDFCSHKCPFSLGVDPHFAALVRTYADNDEVVFLSIDSHNDTSIEEIRAHAEANNLPQPILKDLENRYADAVGALVTPDFYIVDREGKLAYRGAFDNRLRPDRQGSRTYVADAVAALLAGTPVDPEHVPSWGCTIKRVD